MHLIKLHILTKQFLYWWNSHIKINNFYNIIILSILQLS